MINGENYNYHYTQGYPNKKGRIGMVVFLILLLMVAVLTGLKYNSFTEAQDKEVENQRTQQDLESDITVQKDQIMNLHGEMYDMMESNGADLEVDKDDFLNMQSDMFDLLVKNGVNPGAVGIMMWGSAMGNWMFSGTGITGGAISTTTDNNLFLQQLLKRFQSQ